MTNVKTFCQGKIVVQRVSRALMNIFGPDAKANYKDIQRVAQSLNSAVIGGTDDINFTEGGYQDEAFYGDDDDNECYDYKKTPTSGTRVAGTTAMPKRTSTRLSTVTTRMKVTSPRN